MSLFSCTGQRPINLGITDGILRSCPSSPNCVSSTAVDEPHKIPPFQLITSNSENWERIKTSVSNLPRTKIIQSSSDYLHAECSSAIFGFIDDLELQLHAVDGKIDIRSAARLGHSDFGVNRKRIDALRKSLLIQGVIQ